MTWSKGIKLTKLCSHAYGNNCTTQKAQSSHSVYAIVIKKKKLCSWELSLGTCLFEFTKHQVMQSLFYSPFTDNELNTEEWNWKRWAE